MLRKLLTPIISALMCMPAFADCVHPESIRIPDGATATNEEMVDGQMRVKEYMAEMEAYLDCLDKESAAAAEERTAEESAAVTQVYNSAVDEMHRIASAFNEEVRAYKATKH